MKEKYKIYLTWNHSQTRMRSLSQLVAARINILQVMHFNLIFINSKGKLLHLLCEFYKQEVNESYYICCIIGIVWFRNKLSFLFWGGSTQLLAIFILFEHSNNQSKDYIQKEGEKKSMTKTFFTARTECSGYECCGAVCCRLQQPGQDKQHCHLTLQRWWCIINGCTGAYRHFQSLRLLLQWKYVFLLCICFQCKMLEALQPVLFSSGLDMRNVAWVFSFQRIQIQ